MEWRCCRSVGHFAGRERPVNHRVCAARVVRLTVLVGFLVAGCTSSEVRPVPFPALAGADDTVRQQIDTEYTELLTRAENRQLSTADRGAAYGALGRLFLAASLLVAAEPALLNAHELIPSDPQWPYYLGHLYRTRGDFSAETAMFEEVARLDPDDVPTAVWLGRAYLGQNRVEAAEAEFLRALSVVPGSLPARVGLGRAALTGGDYARAVLELERVLAIEPGASGAHYPLGLAYRGLGDEAAAESYIARRSDEELEVSDPRMESLAVLLNNAQAYERRGLEAMEDGLWSEAEAQFRSGLVVAPAGQATERLSLMHKLGTVLWLSGDVDAAIEQFTAGVQLSPKFVLNHFSLGLVMASLGEIGEARQRFATAIEYDPNYVEARIALGDALLDLGQPEAAIPHYVHALQVSPDVADARLAQAAALAELGRTGEASQLLVQGLELHPNDERFADGLAILLGF